MKSNVKLIAVASGIIVVMLVAIIVIIVMGNKANRISEKALETGSEKLQTAEQVSVKDSEESIDALLEKEKKEAEEKAASSQKEQEQEKPVKKEKLSNKEIKTIFKDSVFVGDSLTEGIEVYQFLSKSNVVYHRGMSVPQMGDLSDTIVGLNPKQVFLWFGMNDLIYFSGDADKFAEAYAEQIKALQKKLPDATIYVNSILPIRENAIKKKSVFKYYEDYNGALEDMCQKMGITFIDATALAEAHSDQFEPDGIHISSTFYPYWFKNVAEKAGRL